MVLYLHSMKKLILILMLGLTTLFAQQRSIIFNTGNPAYTCNDAGGSYSNYTCDNACNPNSDDYCTIMLDGVISKANIIHTTLIMTRK